METREKIQKNDSSFSYAEKIRRPKIDRVGKENLDFLCLQRIDAMGPRRHVTVAHVYARACVRANLPGVGSRT